MKILVKYLLVASAIILPAIGYAGSGHDHNGNQNTTHESRKMAKECPKGEKCPMTDEMKDMDEAEMQQHMKEMNNNHNHDGKDSNEGHNH